MKRFLTLWNLLGLGVFLLGSLVYWEAGKGPAAHALPLPAEEQKTPSLSLVLYRPNPPQGFLKETLALELGPGETPEAKALTAWAEALKAPKPKALFQAKGAWVVDLPQDFAQGLDAALEVYRLYSLVYTLLSTFPEAKEVRFLVEGRPSPGLAHLDLSLPYTLP
ncbi:Sporulation and spore germination [Thermus arciformis]|uniref:Sporulation and spore germination n=1 Tax=Thermus arciformis TaxID=482827 RepID=A0A1G7H8Q3_9DEIN|nr:GerMN domain-containing protein [Thermus arciformis]SDE96751.1 Sporulation and spore germination [Thermus arciformis]